MLTHFMQKKILQYERISVHNMAVAQQNPSPSCPDNPDSIHSLVCSASVHAKMWSTITLYMLKALKLLYLKLLV